MARYEDIQLGDMFSTELFDSVVIEINPVPDTWTCLDVRKAQDLTNGSMLTYLRTKDDKFGRFQIDDKETIVREALKFYQSGSANPSLSRRLLEAANEELRKETEAIHARQRRLQRTLSIQRTLEDLLQYKT